MTVRQEKEPRKRKNRYIPNLAAARFKPNQDWTENEAREEYERSKFPFPVDQVSYQDCISGMKKLPEESVDVVIADPPFGISFTGKESIYNRDYRLVQDGYYEINRDYAEFSSKWIGELARILKDTGSAWIFSGWTNLGDILNAIRDSGLTLVNHIIWRYQFGVFTRRKFVTSHYHVLFLARTTKYYFNKIVHYPLDVWEINRTYKRGERKNSTKLPEELIVKCIDFTTRPGSLVLDPFMGNGTTAVVAKGTFRHHLGFEINKSMQKVIDGNVKSVKLGEFYTPYSKRQDELVIRAKRRYAILIDQPKIESWVNKV